MGEQLANEDELDGSEGDCQGLGLSDLALGPETCLLTVMERGEGPRAF